MKAKHTIINQIRRGKGRGRRLGFPTANMSLGNNNAIPDGIYAAVVNIEGTEYFAATFIGAAKTYAETEKQAETYILNFNDDLYGQEVEINLFEKIRDNQAFASEKDLIKMIKNDVEKVKEFF